MKEQTLDELLGGLEQELLRLGYVKGTMTLYRNRWRKLKEYAAKKGESHYTEQLGIDFANEYFGIRQDDLSKTLTQAQAQDLRIIRMIGDYQIHRAVLRRYQKHREILTDKYYKEIADGFGEYCEKLKTYSNVTTGHYVKQSSYFMDYLAAQGKRDFAQVGMKDINAYIRTLAGFTYKTVEQNICSLRALFRYLNETGVVDEDYASKMPMVRARKQTGIPSVWTQDELKKLIGAIDRGSPKGKRDYAIIMIACRLGLRSMDIKHLRMENFRWVENKICFTQSKTKQGVELPLLPDVGWAVIDYLRYGRPKVDTPYIFVRHVAPFLPFTDENHLSQLIRSYMEKAHIPVGKKRRGMHSMRHTLASVLLEKETPHTVIAEIIGHIDTNSTAVYMKVDFTHLSECPLDYEEVIRCE